MHRRFFELPMCWSNETSEVLSLPKRGGEIIPRGREDGCTTSQVKQRTWEGPRSIIVVARMVRASGLTSGTDLRYIERTRRTSHDPKEN